MKLYQPIHLDCMPAIKKYAERHLNQFKDREIHAISYDLPIDLRDIIDNELKFRGISNSTGYLGFTRKNINMSADTCHIDGNADSGIISYASIIIPIFGCKNSFMYWYDGDYELIHSINPEGVKYFRLKWNSVPSILDNIEIFDNPMLCRVDIPHSATSNGIEYRSTFTFRFKDNETFNELCEKFA